MFFVSFENCLAVLLFPESRSGKTPRVCRAIYLSWSKCDIWTTRKKGKRVPKWHSKSLANCFCVSINGRPFDGQTWLAIARKRPRNPFVCPYFDANENRKEGNKDRRMQIINNVFYIFRSFSRAACGGGVFWVILIRNDGNEIYHHLLSRDRTKKKMLRTKGFCFVIFVAGASIYQIEGNFFGNQMDRCISVCTVTLKRTWGRLSAGVRFSLKEKKKKKKKSLLRFFFFFII